LPRRYEPIWERIKSQHFCAIEVHKLIVSRTVKAVIKEKDRDVAFKMANDKDKLFLAIKRIELADKKHIRIEFRLKQRYGLLPITQEISL
jgi:hypothetical protein